VPDEDVDSRLFGFGQGGLNLASNLRPRAGGARIRSMGCKTFAKQGTLRVRNREAILVSNDPIPQGSNVANFVFCRQIVETRRGER
jgi:hypothetical protein